MFLPRNVCSTFSWLLLGVERDKRAYENSEREGPHKISSNLSFVYVHRRDISNQIWKAWFKDNEKERLQRDCIAFGRMKLLKFGRQCFYLSACNKDNFTRFPFIKCCSGAAQTGAFACVHTHMHGKNAIFKL